MKKIILLPLFVLLSCSQDPDISVKNQNEYNIEDINLQLQKISYQIEELQAQINLNSSLIDNMNKSSPDNRLTRDRDYINNEMSVEMLQQLSEGNFITETGSTQYDETISLDSVSRSDENPIEKIKQLAKELKEDEGE
tara:strand:+ start:3781 stop:4194 length:414 start_codon:yes stop_codon:yes gene_type:complete